MPPPNPERSDGRVERRSRLVWLWPWGVGALIGLVVVGPGLGPGSLLNLDLLVTPHIPIPNGVFGLGPALSQRVPSFVVLGAVAAVVGGPVATKVAIVAMVAAAFAGAARLTGPSAGPLARIAAGVLWAAGPFALTRIGVGHLNVMWAIAVLPWVLPRLCRPSEAPWSTFLAAGLLAFGGPASGTLGVVLAAVALLLEPRRRPGRVALAVGVANLAWVAPTAVLLWAGAAVHGSGGFRTHPVGAAGWPGVLVGNGFWRADQQVGAVGIWGAVGGAVVVGLALLGRKRLDRAWERPATVVALLGLVLAAASAIPGVRDLYRHLTDLSVGAPLRESHRFLALWLVTAAPAAALGGEEFARRLRDRVPAGTDTARASGLATLAVAAPLAIAVAVAIPGWWGIGGRLDPVEFPSGWAAARTRIHAAPGTTVALPWSEYPELSFAGNRQAFNPIPDYLGGDVISSFDPLLDAERPSQEQVDRRAPVVDRLVRRVRAGRPIGAALADLGVRWVFVAHERSWETYTGLAQDPGLRLVVGRPDVDLYAVRGWRGPVTTSSGARRSLSRPVPPLLRTDAPAGSVIDIAGAPGWVRGWGGAVRVTDDGRLALQSDNGLVWFWPAAALLALDLGLVAAVIVAQKQRRSERRDRATCTNT